MNENWIGYELDTEEGFFLCTFNLGVAEIAPDNTRDQLVRVRMPFKEPGEDAMGTPEEREAFSQVEAALEKRLKAHKAVHFATVRGGEIIDALYYMPSSSLEGFARQATDAGKGCDLEVSATDDPDWEMFGTLFPSAEDTAQYNDHQVLAQMQNAGDASETPRVVEHFVFMPDEQGATAAIAHARDAGFTLADRCTTDGELPIMLTFSMSHAATIDAVSDARRTLMELIESAGGEYDGWESPVVNDAHP